MIEFIRICLGALAIYAAFGSIFAAAFHWQGLHKIDPATRGAGLGFRLMITAGVIALWPYLAWHWRNTHLASAIPHAAPLMFRPERLRGWHRLAWQTLAVAVPVVIAAALWWRPRAVAGSKLDTGRSEWRSPSKAMPPR